MAEDKSPKPDSSKPYFNKQEGWLSETLGFFIWKAIKYGRKDDLKMDDLFKINEEFLAQNSVQEFYQLVQKETQKKKKRKDKNKRGSNNNSSGEDFLGPHPTLASLVYNFVYF